MSKQELSTLSQQAATILPKGLIEELSSMIDQTNELEEDVAKVRAIWQQLEKDNPHLEQVSSENWPEKCYRMWLHGATNSWECNELERWLYGDLPITKTALSPARDIYKAWRKWLKTAGFPKFKTNYVYDKKSGSWREVESKEPSDTYYATNDKFDVEEPPADETLLDFIVRLARSIEDDGKGHRLEYRALKSFVDFIRKNYPIEQVAFIEHISPQKMDLHFGRSIRLISPKALPSKL